MKIQNLTHKYNIFEIKEDLTIRYKRGIRVVLSSSTILYFIRSSI